MTDARSRSLKIREATAAEYAAWDRATERRADAEYALEQFKERQDLSPEERAEFEERTWQAFWRVTVEGQDTAEVAAQLGISANGVRQAKSRVLRRLREELGELE